MDNRGLSFRAQSLDNKTPDPIAIQIDNQIIPEEDMDKRRELAQNISEVVSDGTQVFSEGSHNAFLHGDKFLLETPPEELDDAGRVTPILCYGHVPNKPPASWSGKVVKAVVGFAEHIGRTISPKSQEIASYGIDAVLKETLKKNRMRVIGKTLWGIGASLIAVLIAFVKISIEITRLRRRRKKMLRGAGILVIVLVVLGMIYKILFRE